MKEGALALTSINIIKMSSVTFTLAEKQHFIALTSAEQDVLIGKKYTIIEECMTQIKVEKNEKRREELRCLEADTREEAFQMGLAQFRLQGGMLEDDEDEEEDEEDEDNYTHGANCENCLEFWEHTTPEFLEFHYVAGGRHICGDCYAGGEYAETDDEDEEEE